MIPQLVPSSALPSGGPLHQEPLERVRINFTWILKLRWAAAAGQLWTILLVAWLFRVELPMVHLCAILAVEVASNLLLAGWFKRTLSSPVEDVANRIERALGWVMLLDIVLLTALLYLTGGPDNPFSVFYLINLVLSAVVLPPRWTWALNGVVLVAYALLFFHHRPLPELELVGVGPGGDSLTLQQKGVPIAFGAAVVVIAVFVTRVTSELATVESMLRDARLRRDRSERLEALGTLAAGAAHELASPLSTIAVVAKDLEIALQSDGANREAEEDSRLIRREVERCRAILDQMSGDAGQSAGEREVEFSLDELFEATTRDLKRAERVEVAIPSAGGSLRLVGPKRALSLAVRQIIKNALDASPPEERVRVQVDVDAEHLVILVDDVGAGMSPEAATRATEPFFTTKEPGQGMGLGLFLAHGVVDRLEGRIQFESSPGSGTRVRVELPKERVIAPARRP